jgi:hypothetical protein
MVYADKPVANKDSYKPSRELVRYLDERLQLETRRAKKRKAAGDKQKNGGKVTDEREDNKMSRRKNYFLNKYVFRSMANLIVFFEYASINELRKVFDRDLKELLLNESALEPGGIPIFRRLVRSAFAGKIEKQNGQIDPREWYGSIQISDFKFLLAEMIQWELFWLMLARSAVKVGTEMDELLKPDMRRALFWAHMLASGVKEKDKKFNPSNRPVLF